MLDLPNDIIATQRVNEPSNRRGCVRRVGILSYRSDPKVGGQGVYVDYLSQALAEMGLAVDVISGPPYPILSPSVNLIKLPSLDLYAQPHNGNLALRPRHLLSSTDTYEYFGHLSGKFVEPFTFGQRAYQYLKKNRNRYDIIFDNQTLAKGVLSVTSDLNIPLAGMIHHPITRDRKLAYDAAPDWRHRWLVRRWYAFHRMQIRVARQMPVITCPSEAAKADIVSEFGVEADRIHPIPLGVDQQTFKPDSSTKRQKERLITTASADTPLKGLHVLIEAYSALLKSRPNLELVVIGKLRKGLAKNAIQAHGLQNKVEFKSDLSREDLAREFCAATIAITPSMYEGFGLPAAEAMSCGTPVIVTDGGALPEVAGDAGIIVPRGDADALAAAIEAVLADPSLHDRMSRDGYQRAIARFNWEKIAPKYLEFFETAVTS